MITEARQSTKLHLQSVRDCFYKGHNLNTRICDFIIKTFTRNKLVVENCFDIFVIASGVSLLCDILILVITYNTKLSFLCLKYMSVLEFLICWVIIIMNVSPLIPIYCLTHLSKLNRTSSLYFKKSSTRLRSASYNDRTLTNDRRLA